MFTPLKINYYVLARVENLCAGVSFVLQFLVKEHLACFSTLVTSALQLAIDQDDDGIIFDKHGPDRLSNFFPSGGSLSSGASLHGQLDESIPDSMS